MIFSVLEGVEGGWRARPVKTRTRVTGKRRGHYSLDMGPLRRLIRGGGGGGTGRAVLQAVLQPQQHAAIARCPVSIVSNVSRNDNRLHREPARWRRLGGREAGPVHSFPDCLLIVYPRTS